MLKQVEKSIPAVAVVVAGVLVAGFIMNAFSTNTYVAEARAGYRA